MMLPKLAVFDIDGTLISWPEHQYIWEFLLHDLGLTDWNKTCIVAYRKKKISYAEWHEVLFSKMKKINVTKELLYSSIVKALPNAQDMEAVQNFLYRMSKRFEFLAVLSGGLVFSLELASISLSLFNVLYAHSLIFDNEGILKDWKINPYGSDVGKFYGLVNICQSLNVGLNDTLYIGDGLNDLQIINKLCQHRGIGFSIPPLSKSDQLLSNQNFRGNNLFDVERILR